MPRGRYYGEGWMSKGVGIPKKCNTNRGNPWGEGEGSKGGHGGAEEVPKGMPWGALKGGMPRWTCSGESQGGQGEGAKGDFPGGPKGVMTRGLPSGRARGYDGGTSKGGMLREAKEGKEVFCL